MQQIVIADDDRDLRRGLELRARKWGYDVIAVEDGEQACELLIPEDGPSLAILDQHMPRLDGVQVCEQVRAARPHNEVFMMMLTGRDSVDDVANALNAGADDYVTKPYNEVELQARLKAGSRIVEANEAVLTKVAHSPPCDDPQTVLSRVRNSMFLVPEFDAQQLTYGFGAASQLLAEWEASGGIKPVTMDRIHVCPDCRGLPTFRDGCGMCGSARVTNECLIHHFRCGYVDVQQEFQTRAGVMCPKCLARDMVVGVDFEHVMGPYHCTDCGWEGTELDSIGQCIQCGLRFPAHEAGTHDLVGYHVERDDLLADSSAL